MKGRKKRVVKLTFLALVIFIATAMLSFAFEPLFVGQGSQFESVHIELSSYDLNDLGIVDANLDNNLDIFTTNHSSQQSLLVGDGTGTFENVFAGWGLSQDREFPQIENSAQAPSTDAPGFYLYRQRNRLHLVASGTEAWGDIRGMLELSAAVRFEEQSQVQTSLEKTTLPSGVTVSKLQFTVSPGGHLSIRTIDTASKKNVIEIPHQLRLEDGIPLSSVYVGQGSVNPSSRQFELLWRDRHSMSWSDVNADGLLDVFIARGGIHGQMNKFPEQFADELFINQGNTFEDQVHQAGLLKNGCSARQSAWVDFDEDGRLDIFVVCGRNASDGQDRPHQLFHQRPDTTFENVAEQVGLDLPRVGEFSWIDMDLDNQVDVLATQDGSLSLYTNQGGQFISESLSELADNKVKQFTTADFDLDGRSDVYLSGRLKSYLIQQTDAGYTLADPTKIGLPGYSLCASWVDYDNDGLSDLHVVPGGLYRQQPDHRFVRSQLLSDEAALVREKFSRSIGWERIKQQKARCSWFDYNNDGFRDLVLARQRISPVDRAINRLRWQDTSSRWKVQLFKNKGTRAHWLEVVLKGQPGNLEAVGATIAVETPTGTQHQRVGSSEGSHFSQGHYRVYFGLGDHKEADRIAITWPDGQEQVLSAVSADQLLLIEQPKAGSDNSVSA